MKVLWPQGRSSLAPMRVKMRSTEVHAAASAAEQGAAPVLREQGEQGDLPDIGAFAGHVRAGDEGDLGSRAIGLLSTALAVGY